MRKLTQVPPAETTDAEMRMETPLVQTLDRPNGRRKFLLKTGGALTAAGGAVDSGADRLLRRAGVRTG